MLIVINSKSRLPNRREMETRLGNSATHGAHHVAQTLISRTLFVSFLTSAATVLASMVSRATGVLLHCSSIRATSDFFSSHFVEQPIGRVTSTGTGLPASIASRAFRASADFTVAGSA